MFQYPQAKNKSSGKDHKIMKSPPLAPVENSKPVFVFLFVVHLSVVDCAEMNICSLKYIADKEMRLAGPNFSPVPQRRHSPMSPCILMLSFPLVLGRLYTI